MPTYDPNTTIKSEIFKLICSNQNIVSLIKNVSAATVPDRTLMYEQVWPYRRVYECCKAAGTHICFDVVTSEANTAQTKGLTVTFILLTHESLMRTDSGTRLDRLENEILLAFNGNRDFGIGRLLLKKSRPNDSGDIPEGWHWRRVEFEYKDFNIKSGDPLWV